MIWFASASAGTEVAPSTLAHFGADLLTDLYTPPVTEPIRMQASAQRYLAGRSHRHCASSCALGTCVARRWSIPMTEPERECFVTMRFASDAIRLCRWSLTATAPRISIAARGRCAASLRAASTTMASGGVIGAPRKRVASPRLSHKDRRPQVKAPPIATPCRSARLLLRYLTTRLLACSRARTRTSPAPGTPGLGIASQGHLARRVLVLAFPRRSTLRSSTDFREHPNGLAEDGRGRYRDARRDQSGAEDKSARRRADRP